jgi:hypothetical protein
MLVVAWFMLAAAIVILVSYLLIRLLIPVLPAAGVFFIIDAFRDTAIGWLRKVAGLLVMGPLYFLAALLVGRFNVAILGTTLNPVLKLVFIGAIAVVAWRLLQPRTFLGQSVKVPGMTAVTNYFGARRGAEDAIDEAPPPTPAPVIEGTPAREHLQPPTPAPAPQPAPVYSPVEVYNPNAYRPHEETHV